MANSTNRSPFAEALTAALDDTNLFNRKEWAKFFGVKESMIEDWVNDRALPRPDNLSMMVLCLEGSSDVNQGPVEAFKAIAARPATEVSPHGKRMLPTVMEYAHRLMFSPLSSALAKLSPDEQGELLTQIYVSPEGALQQPDGEVVRQKAESFLRSRNLTPGNYANLGASAVRM